MKELIEKVVEPQVARAIVDPQDVELYHAYHNTFGYWQHAYVSRFRSTDTTFTEFKEEVRKSVLQQSDSSPVEIIFTKVRV